MIFRLIGIVFVVLMCGCLVVIHKEKEMPHNQDCVRLCVNNGTISNIDDRSSYCRYVCER